MKTVGIISGILMCILGGCAMAMPFRTFLGIGWLVGALFLVYGIQTAINAMQKEKKDGWTCALGVLAAILGVWITFSGIQRALTDMTIAYLVGALLIASGVLRCMEAVKMFKEKAKKQGVILALCGAIALIAGFFAVGHPIMTMISVGYIIAIDLMVQGITMIVAACMIKKSE